MAKYDILLFIGGGIRPSSKVTVRDRSLSPARVLPKARAAAISEGVHE